MPIFGTLPSLALPFVSSSIKGLLRGATHIRTLTGIGLWLLLFWATGHTHRWIAGNMLYCHTYTGSAHCAEVSELLISEERKRLIDRRNKIRKFYEFKKNACFVFLHALLTCCLYSHRTVMLVAMGYLLGVHLMRQFYDYGSYALDITGPLMIITQKVTSLAFSIHDGFTRREEVS